MFLTWLRQLVNRQSARSNSGYHGQRRTRRGSLHVEILEDRTLPATLFVVPGNIPADAAHFHSLSDAVLAAAPVGDLIQVEPGSAPGGLGMAATLSYKTLTIQGDPADAPNSLPLVGSLNIDSGNYTLNNLNLSSVQNIGPSVDIVVSNSQIENVTYQHIGGLAGLWGQMRLSGDTITGFVLLQGDQLGLADHVTDCTFQRSVATTPAMLHLENEGGTTIIGNKFTSSAANDTAVEIDASTDVTVQNNIINLTAGDNFDVGIFVINFINTGNGNINNTGNASATLMDNIINTSTNAGWGIATAKAMGRTLTVTIEGNDLRQNQKGLIVFGDGTNLGTIDAGSLFDGTGGNNFEGFDTGNPAGRGAIQTVSATTGVVQAENNLWSVLNPQTAVAPAQGTQIQTNTLVWVFGNAVEVVMGPASHLNITDDGHGDICVGFNRGPATTLQGIDEVTVNIGSGHHVVSYQLDESTTTSSGDLQPAEVLVNLGGGEILSILGPQPHMDSGNYQFVLDVLADGDAILSILSPQPHMDSSSDQFVLDVSVDGGEILSILGPQPHMDSSNDQSDVVVEGSAILFILGPQPHMDGSNGQFLLEVSVDGSEILSILGPQPHMAGASTG